MWYSYQILLIRKILLDFKCNIGRISLKGVNSCISSHKETHLRHVVVVAVSASRCSLLPLRARFSCIPVNTRYYHETTLYHQRQCTPSVKITTASNSNWCESQSTSFQRSQNASVISTASQPFTWTTAHCSCYDSSWRTLEAKCSH